MADKSFVLPAPQLQVAVFKKEESNPQNQTYRHCELTLVQAERITENGTVIPARSITIRKVEAIEALSDFLLDMIADPAIFS